MTFMTILLKSAWYLYSSNILHTHDSNNKPLIETIIKKLPQQFSVIEAQLLILNMSIKYSFLLSSFDWERINYYVSVLHKQADSKFVLSNCLCRDANLDAKKHSPLLMLFTCFFYIRLQWI